MEATAPSWSKPPPSFNKCVGFARQLARRLARHTARGTSASSCCRPQQRPAERERDARLAAAERRRTARLQPRPGRTSSSAPPPPPRPPSALPPASAAARRSPPCGVRAAPRRSRRRPRSAPAARLLLCSITNSTISARLMSTGALREPCTTLSCTPDTLTNGWSLSRGCRVPCALGRLRRAGAGPPPP